MERWAKSLNQKKESARMPIYSEAQGMQSNGTSTASADIGFAVLEKKNTAPTTSTQSLNVFSGQKPESVYSAKSQVSFSQTISSLNALVLISLVNRPKDLWLRTEDRAILPVMKIWPMMVQIS